MEKVSLRETISEDGTFGRHLNDYCRQLVHTEEMPDVIRRAKMVLNPSEFNKAKSETNIEYEVGNNPRMDNVFYANVLSDLRVRGVVGSKLPSAQKDRVGLLRKCLLACKQLQMDRDALNIDEDASNHRLLDPGWCPPCVLHHNNRTVGKIVQQLSLA